MNYIVKAVKDGKVARFEREDSIKTFATVRRLTDSGWRIKVTHGDRVVLDSTLCATAKVSA